MASVEVVCPNPSCKGRHVEGENVERENWEATWLPGVYGGGEWDGDISCLACGTDGVAADDEAGIDMREEELGTRCPHCGVVFYGGMGDCEGVAVYERCPNCDERRIGP